ncbi:MAG: response regulator [Candidatus Thiodiazotropha sp.]
MAEQALHPYTQHPGDKPLVLIADDSRVVRVSLRNILKDHCDLIEVEDGQQAWDELSRNPAIELVFSDLGMPRLDGRALLTKMRQSKAEHLESLPFVVVTGNEATPEIAQEMRQLGASGMVSKPFDEKLITSYLTSSSTLPQEEGTSDWQDSAPQTDFLDHIPDRSKFMEIASRELSFAIRNKNELTLALLRIDQFDSILDHYSDGAIEHILLAIHDIVEQHIHPDDTLAYLGNGRFAILRPASNAIGTRYLGRRILEDITSKHFYLGESDHIVSASIGISAPDIKPGFRLIDLMRLAEGRLKAALDSGGSKVVDKGNENLTPVSTSPDLTEISTISPTEHTRQSSLFSTEIQRLAGEQVADIKAKYSPTPESSEAQLQQYQQTIESLTKENRQLLEDVEHWKSLSAETDNLRRQLFEIESERQQIKLKFNELQDNYQVLDQQCASLTRENRKLIEEEDQRTFTLRQEHGFTEDENRRLENQMKDLRNRAEKAELESLKLNQLVSSLRENGQLLRMQLDQAQQEIGELKISQQSRPTPAPVASKPDQPAQAARSSEPWSTDSTLLNEIYESELNLTATPNASTIGSDRNSRLQQTRASSAVETTQTTPPQKNLGKPDKPPVSQDAGSSQSVKFPPFRIEKEPILFKNGTNPSAFTIASLILVLLLLGGAVSIFLYLKESPLPTDGNESSETQSQIQPSEPQTAPNQYRPIQPASTNRSITKAAPVPASADTHPVSLETQMEKELTLRQMAEEEFQLKLNQSQSFSPNTTTNNSPSWNPVVNTPEFADSATETVHPGQQKSPDVQPAIENTQSTATPHPAAKAETLNLR